ncbi:hypothetical protein WG66_009773 [Moniliophthora roreri]|nr:hypothetical protein WG66_009773 [Moniliophthora roreri]
MHTSRISLANVRMESMQRVDRSIRLIKPKLDANTRTHSFQVLLEDKEPYGVLEAKMSWSKVFERERKRVPKRDGVAEKENGAWERLTLDWIYPADKILRSRG